MGISPNTTKFVTTLFGLDIITVEYDLWPNTQHTAAVECIATNYSGIFYFDICELYSIYLALTVIKYTHASMDSIPTYRAL